VIDRLRLIKDRPPRFRFRLIDYDAYTHKGIVKAMPHTATGFMKDLMLSVNELCGKKATIRILGTSGTLRALKGKYLPSDRLTKKINSG
jgi:RNase P/RNase MRP subunit POP5